MLGNIEKYGLSRLAVGPMQLKNTKGKTPVLEICALDKIKSGAIKVVLDIKKFLSDQVELVNGEKLDIDSVGGKRLLATGYCHNVPSWLQARRFLIPLSILFFGCLKGGFDGWFFNKRIRKLLS